MSARRASATVLRLVVVAATTTMTLLSSAVASTSACAPATTTTRPQPTAPARMPASDAPAVPVRLAAPPVPRPPPMGKAPWADPPLQRATMHLALSREALGALLDVLVTQGEGGSFALLGARAWRWQRGPFALALNDANKTIAVTTDVSATVELPGTTLSVPLRVQASVQPVLSAQHRLVLQDVVVRVTSDDRRVRFADIVAGLVGHVEEALRARLTTLQVDLAPPLQALATRLGTPIVVPLQATSACFALDLRGLQTGPTILADGLEKQLALTIAPSLTLPCATPAATGASPTLPPLVNVSSIEGGPFSLRVPIAAGWDDLRLALLQAFPQGRLHFSAAHPGLFLSDPDVFASDGELVIGVHVGGVMADTVAPIEVDADLYVVGRPVVHDDVVSLADVRPTLATDAALLTLAAAVKHDELVRALQHALRFDLSPRLATVRTRLVDALTLRQSVVDGVGPLCTRADLGRLTVEDVALHDDALHAVVATTAQLSATLPCPGSPAILPLPAAAEASTAAASATTGAASTTETRPAP